MVPNITRKPTTVSDITTLKLKYTGKIRDSLHDTIPFTEAEKYIINKEEFQRLRRITQTAFTSYAFPGASHSRFEHSLGVMHVADLMIHSIFQNQKRLLDALNDNLIQTPKHIIDFLKESENKNGSIRDTKLAIESLEKKPYLLQCLRFAALLHDIGHAPFSHSCEKFMVTWAHLKENFSSLKTPKWLKDGIKIKAEKLEAKKYELQKIKIRHEIYTLLIIAKIFDSNDEFLNQKMAQDICSVLDLSIAPYSNGILAKSNLQTLFHEIVSGEIDADRMDYLLRDSRECGIIYGYFDLGRILDSLAFYYNSNSNSFHLCIRRSGISAYEDYLRARWSMYQQVYFHKTVTACEAMLEHVNNNSNNFHLPVDIEEYLKIDEHSFYSFISNKLSANNYLNNILKDLIFKRKLWKRVFEEIIPKNSLHKESTTCQKIMQYLNTINCPAEIIESSTNLTNFSPKGKYLTSKNNLKVIIKDVHLLRYLEPIENHSSLINREDEEFLIRRIYISKYDLNLTNISEKEVQKNISEKIFNSSN